MRIILPVVLVVGVVLVAAAVFETAFANPLVRSATAFSSGNAPMPTPPTVAPPTRPAGAAVDAVAPLPRYMRCGTILRPETDCYAALHRRASTATRLVVVGMLFCVLGYLIWLRRRSGGMALAIAVAVVLVLGIGVVAAALSLGNWRIDHAGS